jgi:hypothetical protein
LLSYDIFSYIHFARQFSSAERGMQKYFEINANFLKEKFADIVKNNSNEHNKICHYFVSDRDHNGAILGFYSKYEHLYEIKNLQEHGYTVYPYVSNSLTDINEKLSQSKEKVDLLYLNAHGSNEQLDFARQYEIAMPKSYYEKFRNGIVNCKDEYDCQYLQIVTATGYEINFSNLANNASIILHACSTAEKDKDSLAYLIASNNPKANVFAAKEGSYGININFNQGEHNDFQIENIEYTSKCGLLMCDTEQMTVFKSGEVMQESLEVC